MLLPEKARLEEKRVDIEARRARYSETSKHVYLRRELAGGASTADN
jgi:hypothetical protein